MEINLSREFIYNNLLDKELIKVFDFDDEGNVIRLNTCKIGTVFTPREYTNITQDFLALIDTDVKKFYPELFIKEDVYNYYKRLNDECSKNKNEDLKKIIFASKLSFERLFSDDEKVRVPFATVHTGFNFVFTIKDILVCKEYITLSKKTSIKHMLKEIDKLKKNNALEGFYYFYKFQLEVNNIPETPKYFKYFEENYDPFLSYSLDRLTRIFYPCLYYKVPFYIKIYEECYLDRFKQLTDLAFGYLD